MSNERQPLGMNFAQFKKEWCEAMVHEFESDEEFEESMHEFYIEFKEHKSICSFRDYSVAQWCELFHEKCTLDTFPYMLKRNNKEDKQ